MIRVPRPTVAALVVFLTVFYVVPGLIVSGILVWRHYHPAQEKTYEMNQTVKFKMPDQPGLAHRLVIRK